jgi:hypothetical protein
LQRKKTAVSNERNTAKENSFLWKSKPTKTVVKKRSEGNQRFRLQASMFFPQVKKKKKDGGKNEDADEVEYRCCAGLFCKDQEGEEWVRCQRCLNWANTVWANHWKRAFACARARARVCVCDKCKKRQTLVYYGCQML